VPVFSILGPLQVDAPAPVRITAPQERRLLGALLLRRNRWLGVGDAEDAIWGDERPATHRLTLQTKVSRLRRLIGADRLRSGPDGYALRTGPGECDADEFEDLCGQLERRGPGDVEEQLARAERALALWRGPVLGELCDEPFVGSEAVRLEQMRLTVEERRLELLMRSRRLGEVVATTERLLVDHPYHEAICFSRMQALAQSGRVVDAVRTYQAFRRRLVDEVGVEPSARLVALESRLLAGD
jgi:DNA-binding SARP family transcriptional activator